MKKKKGRPGRPRAVTPEVLQDLELAFTAGATVAQACDFADVAQSTFYLYQQETAGFSERVAEWRARTGLRAKLNIKKAIDEGDADTSRWYLEKTDDAFNPKKRAEITGADGGAVQLAFGWMDEKDD